MMDIRIRTLWWRFDWRELHRFGLYHYGANRVFRIGKLCVTLWRIK